MKKYLRSVLIVCLVSLGFIFYAEHMPDPETESTVPELIAFHDVIYPIWHTAFPARDCTALRGFLPEIEAGMARINAARLPGILREKKTAWEKELADFNLAVETYRKAAVGSDDQALLDAAELLHQRFELQIRVIRPVSKEVDAFHKVLYVVFHAYLPGKKFAAICAVAADMATKAEAITTAELSPRLAGKAEAFQAAAAELFAETKALEAAGASCREEDIASRVGKVHAAYQALEKVFD